MKAVIVAAGYATRLYPLTLNTPKPLLDIGGKPMLQHILEKIEEAEDIDKVFIVTNDKFYKTFKGWISQYSSGKEIVILNDGTTSNDDRLGAIGDILFAVTEGKIDDDILIIAGDNLFEFSLPDMIGYFNEKKSSVIAVYDLKDKAKLARKYGVVELDRDEKIVSFEEKPEEPKTSLTATMCYLFSKEDLHVLEECVRKHEKMDNGGDFVRYLSERKPVYGFIFPERWFDIGSKEQLEEVRKIYGG